MAQRINHWRSIRGVAKRKQSDQADTRRELKTVSRQVQRATQKFKHASRMSIHCCKWQNTRQKTRSSQPQSQHWLTTAPRTPKLQRRRNLSHLGVPKIPCSPWAVSMWQLGVSGPGCSPHVNNCFPFLRTTNFIQAVACSDALYLQFRVCPQTSPRLVESQILIQTLKVERRVTQSDSKSLFNSPQNLSPPVL